MPLRRQGIQQPTGHLFGLFWPLTFVQSHTRAAAVLVDEFDAGQIKCSSEHGDRLRPHAKPESYRFFLGALAFWPRAVFAAVDGLDIAASPADGAGAALVRRTPG